MHNVLNKRRKQSKCFKKSLLASSIMSLSVLNPSVVVAQDEIGTVEEVIVTGFRKSLEAALDLKQGSTGQTDAIVAEDIADFPDLNLAESLQRIPGIAITRSNGEGRTITVRGLSGQYTRVRINGMDARAATDDNNRREFDFNVFASELFNSLVVNKTASAKLGDGSLGAVVDLNTARPFSFQEGSTFLVSGTGQYNDIGENISPRMAGLYAYNDPEGIWGISASLAYSEIETTLLSSNTVRWQKSGFNSVRGQDCSANPKPADCTEVENAFHARIPRYAIDEVTRERLGATLDFQIRPEDSTTISFNALLADYDSTQRSKTIEVLFRGNEAGMDVTDYTLQTFPDRTSYSPEGNPTPYPNNTITAMSVDNAWVRSEHAYRETNSDFSQFTLNVDHDFTDTLHLNVLLGTAHSESHRPHNSTLMYDDRDYDGFRYDYSTGDETPVLAYEGPDVRDATNFDLTVLRDGEHLTTSDNYTGELDVEWELAEEFVLSGGYSIKRFSMNTMQTSRNQDACDFIHDCDTDDDGTNDILGIPGTQALSTLTEYKGASGPGSTTVWATPDMDAWLEATGFYSLPASIDQGRVRAVEEKNKGVWIQANGVFNLASNMRFEYEAGVRYVETEQTSGGYNSGIWVLYERPKYDDTLPSLNTAFWLTDDLVFRASAAQVMARPSLSNLSPGGSVDSFGTLKVSFKNPNLEPSRANNYDLSAEWYFADEAILGIAYFLKEVESFPLNKEFTSTYASTGLPRDLIERTSATYENPEGAPDAGCNPANGGEGCWQIASLINGEGATIEGYEVSFQAPFDSLFGDNLPVVLRDLGVIANYTYVDSEFERPYLGKNYTAQLQDLSNDQWNFTLYYDTEVFSTRVSIASRGEYINNGNASRNGNLYQITRESTYIDWSATYNITEAFSITAEVVNLTDEPFVDYVDETAQRLNTYDMTGRNFLLGARYKF